VRHTTLPGRFDPVCASFPWAAADASTMGPREAMPRGSRHGKTVRQSQDYLAGIGDRAGRGRLCRAVRQPPLFLVRIVCPGGASAINSAQNCTFFTGQVVTPFVPNRPRSSRSGPTISTTLTKKRTLTCRVEVKRERNYFRESSGTFINKTLYLTLQRLPRKVFGGSRPHRLINPGPLPLTPRYPRMPGDEGCGP